MLIEGRYSAFSKETETRFGTGLRIASQSKTQLLFSLRRQPSARNAGSKFPLKIAPFCGYGRERWV